MCGPPKGNSNSRWLNEKGGPFEVIPPGAGADCISSSLESHDLPFLPVLVCGAYSPHYLRRLYIIAGCVFTCGVFYIIRTWFPMIFFHWLHTKVPLSQASLLLIQNAAGQTHVVTCDVVHLPQHIYARALDKFHKLPNELGQYHHLHHRNPTYVRSIIFQYASIRYIFHPRKGVFHEIRYPLHHLLANSSIYSRGLRKDHQTHKGLKAVYGPCLMEVPIVSVFRMLRDEILSPFYVFQLAAICLWIWDSYYQYAFTIAIITGVSTLLDLFEGQRNQYKLHHLARFHCSVSVRRPAERLDAISDLKLIQQQQDGGGNKDNNRLVPSDHVLEQQCSTLLVPGDCIEIQEGMTMPCDVLLLNGECIMMESMLTGECVPVSKSPGAPKSLSTLSPLDNTSVLYAGTKVLSERRHAASYGVVLRTGFGTAQGRMLRSLVHPTSECSMQFYRDAMQYVFLMVVVALVGALVGMVFGVRSGLSREEITSRCLDLFTDAVPPALPAALSVGMSVAITRLQHRWGISCICPSRIVVSGQVNTFVFDKTGTLTVEGLSLYGCVSSVAGQFADMCEGMYSIDKLRAQEEAANFIRAMGTCHSLAWISGQLMGDPLELLIFEYIRWRLYDDRAGAFRSLHCCGELLSTEPRTADRVTPLARVQSFEGAEKLAIIKRFDFSSTLQRMSVIVSGEVSGTHIYCKGAPERVLHLCVAPSVPSNFDEVLHRFGQEGMRVIAFAGRKLIEADVKALNTPLPSRAEFESSLVFLGFLVFSNKLKEGTMSALKELREAGCHCIMATGDNPLTASAVALECGLVSSPVTVLGDLEGPALDALTPMMQCSHLDDERAESVCVGYRQVVWSVIQDQHSCKGVDDTGKHTSPTLLRSKSLSSVLANRDPRDVSLVLTGRAFASLQHSHALTECKLHGRGLVGIGPDAFRAITPTFPGVTGMAGLRQPLFPRHGSEFVMPRSLQNKSRHDQIRMSFEYERKSFTKSIDAAPWFPHGPPKLTGAAAHQRWGHEWPCAVGSGTGIARRRRWDDPLSLQLTSEQCEYTSSASLLSSMPEGTSEEDSDWEARQSLYLAKKDASVSLEPRRAKRTVPVASFEEGTVEHDADSERTSASEEEGGVEQVLRRVRTTRRGRRAGSSSSYGPIFCRTRRKAKSKLKPASAQSSRRLILSPDPVPPASSGRLMEQPVPHERDWTLAFHVTGPTTSDAGLIHVCLFEYVLCNARVFARMTPEDKTTLVACLQGLSTSPLVGMCGDGANDCGALRKADIGVSLSNHEASIAAPFTSAQQTIQSSVDVLREGRASQANSFQTFRFIVLSSILQFFAVVLLYAFGNNFTDSQYLWTDLVTILPLSVFMPWTEASAKLANTLPMRSVTSRPMVWSIVGQAGLNVCFQVAALVWLSLQRFYVPFQANIHTGTGSGEELKGFENTVIFLVLNVQLVTISVATSGNKPWRKDFWTNPIYTVWLVLLSVVAVWLLLLSTDTHHRQDGPELINSGRSFPRGLLWWLNNWMHLVGMPVHFRAIMIAHLMINSLAAIAFEMVVVRRIETAEESSRYVANHVVACTPAALPRERYTIRLV